MQMEYLADGSGDCPLIRIFDFSTIEVATFATCFEELAEGAIPQLMLESPSAVNHAQAISLLFKVERRDRGILQLSSNQFECACTKERYIDMSQLLRPFAEPESYGSRQWLNQDGFISLLITATEEGSW